MGGINKAGRGGLPRGFVDAFDYGATGSGNDTAGLLAASRVAVEQNRPLVLDPTKTYRISDVLNLNVPTPASGERTPWSIDGLGAARIVQQLDNAPIFRVNGINPNGFAFRGLDLRHERPQPKANANAVAILFNSEQAAGAGVGAWNWYADDLKFDNSFRGVAQEQAAGASRPVWGMWARGLRGGFSMSGALLFLSDPGGAGQPNIHIQDVYIRRNDGMTDQEASLLIRRSGLNLESVEINGGSNRAVFLEACAQVEIGLLHLEDVKTTLFGEPFVLLPATNAQIDTLDAGLVHFDGANNGSPAVLQANLGARVRVGTLSYEVGRVGAGTTPFAVRGAATSPNDPAGVEIGEISARGTAIGQFPSSEPWTRYALRLGGELRRRLLSANRGDADVALTDRDDEVQRFNTALTIARAVTLPVNPTKRLYRIVRGPAATGAFNLSIVAGGVTLKALTAANQWADVEYDGAAWVVTASGTL